MLALLNRLTLASIGLDPAQALIGGSQVWSDNLVAIAINVGAALYLGRILALDRATGRVDEVFDPVRRFVPVDLARLRAVYGGVWCAGSIAFLAVHPCGNRRPVPGPASRMRSPCCWWDCRSGSAGNGSFGALWPLPSENRCCAWWSCIYWFYLGWAWSWSPWGVVLAAILRVALGEAATFPDFISQISSSLSIAIPMAGVWSYYGRALNREVAALPDAPRRAGLDRLYHYLLAGFRFWRHFCRASAVGALRVSTSSSVGGSGSSSTIHLLANALAALAVGLPLWELTWQPMQAQARASGTAGDLARRSILRKAALYLALFGMVIGAMVSAGELVYQVLSHLLGSAVAFSASDALTWAIHLPALPAVVRLLPASTAHGRPHRGAQPGHRCTGLFSTLLIDPGDGRFAAEVGAAPAPSCAGDHR